MAEKFSSEEKEKVYKCKQCKISFSDVYEYTDHLESKQHKKQKMKLQYGEKYLEAKAKLEGKDSTENAHEDARRVSDSSAVTHLKTAVEKVETKSESEESSEDDDDDDEVFACELCSKICTGLLNYRLHLEGKKHSKKVKEIELMKKLKKKNLLPDTTEQPKRESIFKDLMPQNPLASNDIECRICNKKCSGPQPYKQHCKSEAHKKKEAMQKIKKEMETQGKSSILKTSEGSNLFYCDICDKECTGPLPYTQHMESIAHQKQARHNEDLDKLKDLMITSEGDSKIKCVECGKIFSGPVPFNDHIKSSAHQKLKKKSSLMESLEKQHPEMIRTVQEKCDDDSEEESAILGCDICNTVFPGPESAKDHFESPKHKKAKKKKAEFMKFKLLKESKKNKSKVIKDSSSDAEDEFDIIPSPKN